MSEKKTPQCRGNENKETELLIPEPNDVRTIAYLLLINGYTVRAEATMVTSCNGPFQGPTTIEAVHLFFRKDPTADNQIKNEVVNTDEKYDSDTVDEQEHSGSCPTYRQGVPCCLEKNHKGDHSYKCDCSGCPGYSWPASETAHPYITCKPDSK